MMWCMLMLHRINPKFAAVTVRWFNIGYCGTVFGATMASAANANMNAVRETMDGKDRCIYNDQTMSVLITDASVTMFFHSPAGNFSLIEHWVGHGVSVHLCETVWAGHQPRGLICCHQRAAQSVGVPEGTSLRGHTSSFMHIQRKHFVEYLLSSQTSPINVYYLSPLGGCSWPLNIRHDDVTERGVCLTGTVYCEGLT